jgi:hypothetical protein
MKGIGGALDGQIAPWSVEESFGTQEVAGVFLVQSIVFRFVNLPKS